MFLSNCTPIELQLMRPEAVSKSTFGLVGHGIFSDEERFAELPFKIRVIRDQVFSLCSSKRKRSAETGRPIRGIPVPAAK